MCLKFGERKNKTSRNVKEKDNVRKKRREEIDILWLSFSLEQRGKTRLAER